MRKKWPYEEINRQKQKVRYSAGLQSIVLCFYKKSLSLKINKHFSRARENDWMYVILGFGLILVWIPNCKDIFEPIEGI